MPRVRMPWFRFYSEAMRDMKLRMRPPAERWAWAALMSIASEADPRGYLLIDEEAVTVQALADVAAITQEEAESALAYFVSKGMVANSDDGTPFISKWGDRQFESDVSSERTAKHRSKEQLNAVLGNNKETFPPSVISVTSVSLKEEEQKRQNAQFAEFWSVYPRRDDKPRARRAFSKALERADFDAILGGAQRYRDDPNRKPGFTKMPATWLNADAWDNPPLPAPDSHPSAATATMARIPPPLPEEIRCGACQGSSFVIDDEGLARQCQVCHGTGRTA